MSRSVAAVAVDAGGVAVVVEKRGLGGIMLIGRGREGVSGLWRSVFGEDVERDRRDVGAAVVAGDAILFVGAAEEAGWSLRIVWSVARDAGVGCDRGVAAYVCLGRKFVLRDGVGACGPIRQRVYFASHLAGWVVAG